MKLYMCWTIDNQFKFILIAHSFHDLFDVPQRFYSLNLFPKFGFFKQNENFEKW